MSSRPKIECPIDQATRVWIDQRWQWLCRQFGEDRVRKAQVILPKPEFFPEPYAGTEDDAEIILYRVAHYMTLDPATVALRLYAEERPVFVNKDGTTPGTAGLYFVEDGKFQICIEANNLDTPAHLVATFAHELGHVHLLGHGRLTDEEDDHEPLTDLLTVFLGLGVFTANAALKEDYWQDGRFSGWSIARQGYLSMNMFGYAFALFAKARGEDDPPWASELRLDVRTAFRQSKRLLVEEHGSEIVYADHVGLAKPESAEDAETKENTAPTCTYCRARVEAPPESEEEPPICNACRKSIEESYDDTEPSFAQRTSKRVDRVVLYLCLLLLVVFLISMFASQ